MDKLKIIEVTFKIIVENGLESFSIGKLANELGCTKSSIYNYFKSKDDLLNAVFIEYNNRLNNCLVNFDDPIDTFYEYVHTCYRNSDAFKFFHIYSDSKFMSKESRELAVVNRDLGEKLIDELYYSINGTYDYNKLIIHSLVFGPIFGVIMRLHGKHPGDQNNRLKITVSEAEVDVLIEAILRSIRKDVNERDN